MVGGALLTALSPTAASANAPAFDGLPIAYDGAGFLATDRSRVDQSGEIGLRIELDYARVPLRLRLGGDEPVPVVSDALSARLALHLGVFRERIEVGVVAPVSLALYADRGAAAMTGAGAATHYDVASGDLRLFVKVGLARGRRMGLALLLAGVAPSGDAQSFRSDGVWGGELELIYDLEWRRLTFAVNAGLRLHPTVTVTDGAGLTLFQFGSELVYKAAIAVELHPRVSAALELYGSESLAPWGRESPRTTEAAASLRLRAAAGVELFAGTGRSVAYDAARTDDVRVLTGLAWRPLARAPAAVEPTESFVPPPPAANADRDGDGIPDARDRCPDEAEDFDGFEDADGCPDRDNDQDGIPDVLDKCPNQPESFNGVDDEDGCPDEAPAGAESLPPPLVAPLDLPLTVTYAHGQFALDDARRRRLEHAVNQLFQHPEVKRVRVEGHAFAEGNGRAAATLSTRRAETVRDYLISRGIEPTRVQAVGYGDGRPADPAQPAVNRRVEIVVVEP